MDVEITQKNQWTVVALSERVDAFNFETVKSEIDVLLNSGKKQVALDLTLAKFLNLPIIKYISSAAKSLRENDGEFVLLGVSEKLKRQIDIYASLDSMRLYRTVNDWQKERQLYPY